MVLCGVFFGSQWLQVVEKVRVLIYVTDWKELKVLSICETVHNDFLKHLFIYPSRGDYHYCIHGVYQSDYKKICLSLFKDGYADLTSYCRAGGCKLIY